MRCTPMLYWVQISMWSGTSLLGLKVVTCWYKMNSAMVSLKEKISILPKIHSIKVPVVPCGVKLCCFQTSLPLFKEGRPSSKQRLTNKSITLPLYPKRQTTYSWLTLYIQLRSNAALRDCDKAKAVCLLRPVTASNDHTTMQQGEASLKPALLEYLLTLYKIHNFYA